MEDRLRILVVDDVPDVAVTLAAVLDQNGHDVRTAFTAREALEVADTFKPHCVLLDLTMPVTSGAQLAHWLRERFGQDLVLIGVTGNDRIDVLLSDDVRELDHCLRKPVQLSALAKLLPMPRAPNQRRNRRPVH